ncbi:PDR2, partial [Symbiodinium sp. KB8]
MVEHMLAPFFIFQVFSVGLWCLDEYWYYSLFTLALLFVMEAVLVKQRMQSMGMLRKMRKPPRTVYVFRDNKWEEVWSTALVPGDVVSLSREDRTPRTAAKGRNQADDEEGSVCPGDVLLLNGTVVANEAMLTGESIPQLKEALSSSNLQDEVEAMKQRGMEPVLMIGEGTTKRHAQHMVYAGTRILLARPRDRKATAAPSVAESIALPPDGGAVGCIVRTGYDTAQ